MWRSRSSNSLRVRFEHSIRVTQITVFHCVLRGDMALLSRLLRTFQFLAHIQGVHGIVKAGLFRQMIGNSVCLAYGVVTKIHLSTQQAPGLSHRRRSPDRCLGIAGATLSNVMRVSTRCPSRWGQYACLVRGIRPAPSQEYPLRHSLPRPRLWRKCTLLYMAE